MSINSAVTATSIHPHSHNSSLEIIHTPGKNEELSHNINPVYTNEDYQYQQRRRRHTIGVERKRSPEIKRTILNEKVRSASWQKSNHNNDDNYRGLSYSRYNDSDYPENSYSKRTPYTTHHTPPYQSSGLPKWNSKNN
eukprot:UN33589